MYVALLFKIYRKRKKKNKKEMKLLQMKKACWKFMFKKQVKNITGILK